jgi:hypothetical protein
MRRPPQIAVSGNKFPAPIRQNACCRYLSQSRFPTGNAGKLSAMNVNGYCAISSLQRVTKGRNKPHIFAEVAETGFLHFKHILK